VIGVPPGRSGARLLAALCRLDVRRAIALTPGERALELCDGAIAEIDLGRLPGDGREMAPEAAAGLTMSILAGSGAAADVAAVAQGAGLRLYAAWRTATPAAGVVAARAALASGAAARALDRFLAHGESAAPRAA
jgi:anthranilate phosphoribosyltransferase